MNERMSETNYLSDYIKLTESLIIALKNVEKGGKNKANIKAELLNQYNEIIKKEEQNGRYSIFCILNNKNNIPMPIIFFMIISISMELDQTLLYKYRKLFDKKLPDFHFAFLLYGLIFELEYHIVSFLSDDLGIIWCFFEQYKDKDFFLLEHPMKLKKKVLNFFISGNISLAEGMFYYSPYNDNDNDNYWQINNDILNKMNNLGNTSGENIIFGRKGCGKRTVLIRYMRENNRSMILLNSNIYLTEYFMDDDIIIQELLFFVLVTGSSLCIYNMKKEQIRAYQRLYWYVKEVASSCYVLTEDLDCYLELKKEIKKSIIMPDWLEAKENELVWNYLIREYSPEILDFPCPTQIKYTVGEWINKFQSAYLAMLEEGALYISKNHITESLKKQELSGTYGEILNYPYQMDDFIGEEHTKEIILQIISFVKNRSTYLERLNAKFHNYYGKGFTVLFHGPSGTGKTMAALIIAQELHMPLFRADLSKIQDKYIGETEKHLDEIFFTAIQNNCILFFDEADSFFSKRTKIESSHDKYANSATSYLLQKIESYKGIAILATNLLDNFDDAFLRRIHYVIKLSKPDNALREKIWKSLLSNFEVTKMLDYSLLSKLDNFSPARIKETVLSAFMFACQDGMEIIELEHIKKAVQYEFRKESRSVPSDFI